MGTGEYWTSADIVDCIVSYTVTQLMDIMTDANSREGVEMLAKVCKPMAAHAHTAESLSPPCALWLLQHRQMHCLQDCTSVLDMHCMAPQAPASVQAVLGLCQLRPDSQSGFKKQNKNVAARTDGERAYLTANNMCWLSDMPFLHQS